MCLKITDKRHSLFVDCFSKKKKTLAKAKHIQFYLALPTGYVLDQNFIETSSVVWMKMGHEVRTLPP